MKLSAVVLALPLFAGACAGPRFEPPLPTLPAPSPPLAPSSVQGIAQVVAPPDTLPEMPPENPVKAAVAALSGGLVTPRREWFKGLAYVPPYHPNHGYLIYVAEGSQTNLQFGKREIPETASCPDAGGILSLSWSHTGSGVAESWMLQVKAKMQAEGNGQIRCSITTSRAPYTVFFKTMPVNSPAHVTTVRWSDPYRFLAPDDGRQSAPVCQGTDGN